MSYPTKTTALHRQMSRMLAAFLGILLSMTGVSSVQAQMVTVNPVEAPGALTNPLMGFRGGSGPYITVVQQYIPWNAIENLESDSVQKIRDYCNAHWANYPSQNIRVIPRVYLDWDWNPGNEHWPADLQKGDWTSQQFKDRVVRLVERLGEVWNNDPRVAWVQTGLIGYWGEQESPVGVGQDGWAQRLGDAYSAAFPNKQFIVRNMGAWPGYNVGVYWDSFGHPGQRPWAWAEIKNFNNQGRYLTRVIEGETALDWGVEGEFASLYGGIATPVLDAQGQPVLDAQGNPEMSWTSNANVLLGNAQYTDNMINVIRELHCSALGWISGYNPNDPTIATNAARMQKEFGYRFHLTEFSSDARANPGSNLNFQFKVKNRGSAPIYENWPLAVTLIDKNTRQLLWKTTIPNVDIRKWQPGHDYNYTTRTYQTPAQEHLVSASIPLPANLPVGEHLIGVTILEPLSRTPGLFFAVPNFFKQSQTQPLAKIGIGIDATGHTLDGVVFDDLVADDTRSYAVTPQGPFHTLVVEHSDLGTISQEATDGRYAKDTGVEVRALGKVGYGFSSWGGVLAGSTTNPAIIVMDGNKSVSANYVPVTTYRLNTTSSNGTITLSPPGGIYNVGTEVTVTAVPSSGFTLDSWSGDLSGSASSTTVTMTGEKNVTANFSVSAITGPASFGINCGSSSSYTAGDGVLFAADGVWNSGGSAYNLGERPISNTTDDSLHLSNRWGNSFSYNIPLTNWDYEVTLIFSEIYFNSAGSRIFNVELEGSPVITNLDVFSRVGANAAYEETHVVSVNDGTLNIAFSSIADNANISAIKVTRTQRPNSFALVTNATNGAVTSNPNSQFHNNGSVVTVTATPNTGYKFDSWSGDLSGTTYPATVTMNGNKTVTANFSPITTSYSLSTSATHGSIAINPLGGIYHDGTPVTLTAVPPFGCRFDSWEGDLSGTTNPATLTMNSNKTVTASFSWITHNLTITPPSSGTISSNPPGAVHDDGAVVTLTATPASGYEFEAWGGDLTSNGYASPATLTMNSNKSVSAFFRPTSTTIDTTGSPMEMPRVLALGKKYIGDGFLNARGNPGTDIQLLESVNEFAMAGGLFTIEAGVEVTNTWGVIWTQNKADMRIDGIYDISHNSMSQTRVDALTGTGSIHFHEQPWENNKMLNVGVDNGSGTFSGNIQGIYPWSGNGLNIIKHGTGIQIFDNLQNQPMMTIQINQGVVELSNPIAVLASVAAPISGAGSLTKSGIGPLTLSGALTYMGNTVIVDGSLTIPQPAFADTSTVTIGSNSSSPAVLNLPNAGTDIVAQLFIDGVTQPGNGAVYDSLNSSGAITGIGKIQVGLGITYNLTITPPTNGSIASNPSGSVHDAGTLVTLTATPAAGYRFDSWSGAATGTTNPVTLTMNGDKSVSATFAANESYTLTTSAINGSVSISPAGGVYAVGTEVAVTATPSAGYSFGSWSGDLSGSLNPSTITIDGNKSVTANFSAAVSSGKTVLFVVADANGLGSSDSAIRSRLENLGLTVQVVGDESALTGDATGKVLIITSSSVTSTLVTTMFRDVAVPVINWEIALQDDYGFAVSIGTAGSQTALNITLPSHPLAAGLSGIRTVATADGGGFSWGAAGGSPIIIARLNDGSNHPCLYAYEAGAAMATGMAPARRVHLFLQNDTFSLLNADGLKLFDAAVSWALGLDVPIWSQPPIFEGGYLRLEWLGGGTLQKSDNLQDPWIDITGAASPYLYPVTSPAQFFRVKK